MPCFIASAKMWINSSPAWPRIWAPMMRSVRLSINTLRPRGGLGVGASRQPVMHLVRRDTELDPAFLGGSLGEPDTRERGNRENAGRDARIIRCVGRAFDDIAADDPSFVGRDRRLLRTRGDSV